jgi:hypothetical protein
MRFILFMSRFLSLPVYWKYTPWKFCDVPEAEETADTDGVELVHPSIVQTREREPDVLLIDGTFT